MYMSKVKKSVFARMDSLSIKTPGFDFMLALLTGVLVLWLMGLCFKPSVLRPAADFSVLFFLKLSVLFPCLEEYLFRGMLQGSIAKSDFGRKSLCRISSANLTASLLFTAAHFIHHPRYGQPLSCFRLFFSGISGTVTAPYFIRRFSIFSTMPVTTGILFPAFKAALYTQRVV